MDNLKVIIVDATLRSLPYDMELLKSLSKISNVQLWTSVYEKNKYIKNVYLLKSNNIIAKIINMLFLYLVLILTVIRNRNIIVHFQWLPLYEYNIKIEYYIVKIISIFTKRLIFTAHNIEPHESNRKQIESKAYYLFDKIIVHNQYSFNLILRKNIIDKSKMFIIPHGLLCDSIESSAIKKDYKQKKHILLFGGLRDYKGVIELLNAWLSIKDKKDYKLIIAGKDMMNLKEKYPDLINNEYIIYKDKYLDESELNTLIFESKFIIFPYKKISMSGALLKAIYAEKICIVSNLEPFTEIITNSLNGFVINTLSNNDFSNDLSEIISMKNSDLDEITENIKKTKNQYPSWDIIAKKTKEIYEN